MLRLPSIAPSIPTGRVSLLPSLLLGAGLVFSPSPSWATPMPGEALPTVVVEELDGKKRELPDKRIAVVVIYEDSNAGKQNPRASNLIDQITDIPSNKGKIEAVAVADLAKWNWWPAKKFAIAEMKKICAREQATVYTDWPANVRKAWKLAKGKSGFILIGTDGKVRFAAEGPLTSAQISGLAAAITELGASVPDLSTINLDLKHAPPDVKQKIPDAVKEKYPDSRE